MVRSSSGAGFAGSCVFRRLRPCGSAARVLTIPGLERVIDGTPPTMPATYALGCVWWHSVGCVAVPGGEPGQASSDPRQSDPRHTSPGRCAPAFTQARWPVWSVTVAGGRVDGRLASMLGELTPRGRRALAQSVTGPAAARVPGRFRWAVCGKSINGAWLTASSACWRPRAGLVAVAAGDAGPQRLLLTKRRPSP